MAKRAREKINSTTWKHVIRDDSKDRLEIEIGDSKQPDFKPQIKIMGWDNEVNFSVRMTEDNSNIQVIEDGDKILMDKEDLQLQFFDFEANDEYPEGAYKFEYIIKKKPASNILNFTMQSKKLDFFYQPEITDEEAQRVLDKSPELTLLEAKRKMRPENVVGSYAVYHKTKKNNQTGGKHYKAGKIFHIYRPKIIDSTGEYVWGDLNINSEQGTYVVTIPQKFLDTAVYPLKSNDTFGYTTAGGTIGYWFNPVNHPFKMTKGTSTGGTLDSISFYSIKNLDIFGSSIRTAIYKTNGDRFIFHTDNGVTVTPDNTPDWFTENFSGEALSTEDYYVVAGQWFIDSDFFSGQINESELFYDSGSSGDGGYSVTGEEGNVFPTSITYTDESRLYSIYATYTPGGEPEENIININVGDVFKTVDAMKINIGDVWKDVVGVQINQGDVWKTIL